MVHVLVYGMPQMIKKKLATCGEAIRKAVATHANTGGRQNVWAFFVPAQNERDSIVAHVHGLEEGCHTLLAKDSKDRLCQAVAEVIVTHRPKRKITVRGVEVYTIARNPETEGKSVFCR